MAAGGFNVAAPAAGRIGSSRNCAPENFAAESPAAASASGAGRDKSKVPEKTGSVANFFSSVLNFLALRFFYRAKRRIRFCRIHVARVTIRKTKKPWRQMTSPRPVQPSPEGPKQPARLKRGGEVMPQNHDGTMPSKLRFGKPAPRHVRKFQGVSVARPTFVMSACCSKSSTLITR